MADDRLTRTWALCGIAAAAARFVPVPLLDDVVRGQAARAAVIVTVRRHGRDPEGFEPLWREATARHGWLRGRARRATTKLLMFPVRKYAAVFGAVKGVPTDVLRVVLLGRTVDRLLDQGRLTDLPADATRTRAAVEQAIDRTDLSDVRAALSEVLSRTKGLSSAAVDFARNRFSGDGTDVAMTAVEDPAGTGPAGGELAQGAAKVTQALERPQVVRVLARYDAEVDAQLARA